MGYFKLDDIKKINTLKFHFIQWSEKNHVLTVFLDRANKKNALHPQMINEIAFVFQYASYNDNVRALLLKANGDVFCSGLDLKAVSGDLENNISTVPQPNSKILIAEIFNKLYKPKICQLEGDVYAGGLLLVAGCNYVLSLKDITFSLPEVKRGIFPLQVMQSISSIIGLKKTIDWCIRSYKINAEIAKEWGLVDEICNKEN